MKHQMGAHEKVFKCLMIVLLGSLLPMVTIGSLWAWPVPDTGQTKCYNNTTEIPCPAPGGAFYGQDGNYSINPRSYTKLDASGAALPDTATTWVMVKDNVTGLIWENKTRDDSIHDGSKTFTWCDKNTLTNGGEQGTCGTGTGAAATDTEAFIKALNDATFGGFSDWRMPTPTELATIVDLSRYSPTIDTILFPNTLSSNYWSSSTYASKGGDAWGVDFNYGDVDSDGKYWNNAVRAVHGGESGSLDHFVINGDGTVTDTATGLMWQQETVSGKNWQAALAYAEGLSLAGYDDWRLPTLTELRTLVDYRYFVPSIDTTFFPNTLSSNYWSSSNLWDSYAWCVSFSYGVSDYGSSLSKTGAYAVRVVRGVQSGNFVMANAGSKQVVFDRATLDGSASQGSIISWNWTLTHQTNPAYSRTATGQKPILDNLAAGFYDVRLTVSDGTTTSTATNLLAVAGPWDVNGDGKLGLAEAIYILQTTAGARQN